MPSTVAAATIEPGGLMALPMWQPLTEEQQAKLRSGEIVVRVLASGSIAATCNGVTCQGRTPGQAIEALESK